MSEKLKRSREQFRKEVRKEAVSKDRIALRESMSEEIINEIHEDTFLSNATSSCSSRFPLRQQYLSGTTNQGGNRIPNQQQIRYEDLLEVISKSTQNVSKEMKQEYKEFMRRYLGMGSGDCLQNNEDFQSRVLDRLERMQEWMSEHFTLQAHLMKKQFNQSKIFPSCTQDWVFVTAVWNCRQQFEQSYIDLCLTMIAKYFYASFCAILEKTQLDRLSEITKYLINLDVSFELIMVYSYLSESYKCSQVNSFEFFVNNYCYNKIFFQREIDNLLSLKNSVSLESECEQMVYNQLFDLVIECILNKLQQDYGFSSVNFKEKCLVCVQNYLLSFVQKTNNPLYHNRQMEVQNRVFILMCQFMHENLGTYDFGNEFVRINLCLIDRQISRRSDPSEIPLYILQGFRYFFDFLALKIDNTEGLEDLENLTKLGLLMVELYLFGDVLSECLESYRVFQFTAKTLLNIHEFKRRNLKQMESKLQLMGSRQISQIEKLEYLMLILMRDSAQPQVLRKLGNGFDVIVFFMKKYQNERKVLSCGQIQNIRQMLIFERNVHLFLEIFQSVQLMSQTHLHELAHRNPEVPEETEI